MMMILLEKIKNTINKYKMILVLFILWVIFFVFYQDDFLYQHSDLGPHVFFAKNMYMIKDVGIREFVSTTKYSHILGYPLWHSIFFVCSSLLSIMHIYLQDIVLMAIINSSIIVFTIWVITYIYKDYDIRLIDIVGLFFASAIYVPGISEDFYLGQFTPNPWHNPTTIILKPIAIIVVYMFIQLYNNKNTEVKKWSMFSLMMLLSVLAKPSFFQFFVPALFFLAVMELFKYNLKNLFFWFKIACSLIPSCVVVMLQLWIMSMDKTSGNIVIDPLSVWRLFSNNKLLSLGVSVAFPLLVFVVYYKKNTIFQKLSFFLFVVSLFEFIILNTTYDGDSGNFLWGCYISLFIWFLSEITMCKGNDSFVKRMLLKVIYYMHVVSGVVYFVLMHINHMYNI